MLAFFPFVFAILAIGYLSGILAWVTGLGGDSFLELNNFDFKEALFWGETFISSLAQMQAPINKATALILFEALVISPVLYWMIRRQPAFLYGLTLLLVAALSYLVYLGYSGFESGRDYINSLQASFDVAPTGFTSSEDTDLFVYIGESTTSLNMSLYGYPLSTTPQLVDLLKKEPGFLRFDRVRSTHTHTSPSLLKAFALTSREIDGRLAQWGIGRVLRSSGLKPHLYSVQPVNGSFATYSRFVFEGFDYERPKADKYKGNFIHTDIKDHQLLERALKEPGVVFFHSYAGHGAYLEKIDMNLSNQVKGPEISFDGIFGDKLPALLASDIQSDVLEYNQALTYIDRNVSRAIQQIRLRAKPAVFMYFSDHGEAVYTRGGHESSKFIDEMTTVPMLLYFNEAYRKKYPDVFGRYKDAAKFNRTRLLDQVSPTILDVLRISARHAPDVPTLASSEAHPRPYIVERDTVSGKSRIDLGFDVNSKSSVSPFYGGTSQPTYISVINEVFGKNNTICYHRADSYAKALRGAAVADCIEVDMVVDGEVMSVRHPPASETGFSIRHVFDIAQPRRTKLWIDAKNADDPKACGTLLAFLKSNLDRVGPILVEFPWETSGKLMGIQNCGMALKSLGIKTSYYVPTHLLVPCSESPVKNASACEDLNAHVQKVMSSGVFSDLSFDFQGYPAMKRIKGADKLSWNTWAIQPLDFQKFPHRDFDFVIMDTSADPNTH